MFLKDNTEKELWRQAALAALQTVEDVSAKEDREALRFASTVADGMIREYRKRCGSVHSVPDTEFPT